MTSHDEITRDEALRKQALRRLKKRRDFYTHLVIYVLVNGFLVGLWAMFGGGFFWPVFPLGIWGIGVLANAWDVFSRQEIREGRIQREMRRLQHH